MISAVLPIKPEDERADVAGLLAHGGADVVPVVTTASKLVGCLTEREIAICSKMASPKTPSFRGRLCLEALSGHQPV